jgi:hypothetical protein
MSGNVRAAARSAALLIAILSPALISMSPHGSALDDEELEGRVPTSEELAPSVEAAFAAESYAPGSTATLVLFSWARGVTLQLFHAGPETTRTVGDSEMQGADDAAGRASAQRAAHRDRGLTLAERPVLRALARLGRPSRLRVIRRGDVL